MPSLNVRKVDLGLLQAIRVAAAKCGKTMREWVIEVLQKAAK